MSPADAPKVSRQMRKQVRAAGPKVPRAGISVRGGRSPERGGLTPARIASERSGWPPISPRRWSVTLRCRAHSFRRPDRDRSSCPRPRARGPRAHSAVKYRDDDEMQPTPSSPASASRPSATTTPASPARSISSAPDRRKIMYSYRTDGGTRSGPARVPVVVIGVGNEFLPRRRRRSRGNRSAARPRALRRGTRSSPTASPPGSTRGLDRCGAGRGRRRGTRPSLPHPGRVPPLSWWTGQGPT